ncbi:MAG: hypothetical protein ACXADU_07250 [Promethearchaeota archaeon]|jgi:hypothetical protein
MKLFRKWRKVWGVIERDKIATNAQYIFNLSINKPNHGYYFGTYEIGEFYFIRNSLRIVNFYPVEYCTRGCAGLEDQVYFGLREELPPEDSPHYYLVKLDFNTDEKPLLQWKKSVPSAILAILLSGNKLYLGLKTGVLLIWDIDKEECEKVIYLFDSAISAIYSGVNKIIITSWGGVAVSLSVEGNVVWNTPISENKINGILEDEDSIKFLDINGNFYHVDPLSGKIIEEFKWGFGTQSDGSTRSNLIIVNGWYIVTGGAGIWARSTKDLNKSVHKFMSGPFMRTVIPHSRGFFSGDDSGFIRHWDLMKIRA